MKPNLFTNARRLGFVAGLISASLAPGAAAAIAVSGGFSDPPGEIFVTVHDPVRAITYTRDLGVPAVVGFSDLNFEPDALYEMTFADSDPANLRYSVVGLSSIGQMNVDIATTSNSEDVSFPTAPLVTINAIFSGTGNFVSATNAAAGSTDPAENLSVVINDVLSDGYYANSATFDENLGSAVFFNTGAGVGEPLAYHRFSLNLGFPDDLLKTTYERRWLLAANGTLTYSAMQVVDTDGDGVNDPVDNCVAVQNPQQTDGDGDGFGNLCDTDLNNDCITNVVDLGLLRSVFFTSDPAADFNTDGVVNVFDLGAMRSGFLLAPGPSGLASCP